MGTLGEQTLHSFQEFHTTDLSELIYRDNFSISPYPYFLCDDASNYPVISLTSFA